ncbi:MAG: GNAT family N-acetyltransferase [Inhella sp.]
MSELRCVPAGEAPWADLEALFGARGACGGCWCMAWRRTRKDFEAGKGAGNRAALQALWERGEPIGLLGYQGERPVGWVSVAPRGQFSYFKTSRVLRPTPGEAGVWCISCLFVAPALRRQGLAAQLIAAARDWALAQGAQRVEGYPVQPRSAQAAPVFLWTGTPAPFEAAGFTRRPNPHGERPIYASP